MNLGDPELELIDPTPNIHNLFIQFDNLFFCAKLASRAVVRWSKKMYSCAGICSYEGRGGLCDIALSEPLLKLRPRKNLIETLLHEMIHAYLFITCRDNDRDGHGPNFQAHMHRINRSAGINITIYHDFHDEVKLYQTHVWRCNGSCQQWRPHFGIVRRPANRAPGKHDRWWENHKRNCGGTFIKISEPEKPVKKTTKKAPPKPNADITKYINTGKTHNVPARPVLKDSNFVPVKTKSNDENSFLITTKEPKYKPQVDTNKPPVLFTGKGQTLADMRPRSNSVGVVETVRSIWANKQLPTNPTATINNVRNIWANKQLLTNPTATINNNKQVATPNRLLNNTISATNNTPKHKIEPHKDSPPVKVKKIDDYFKSTASTVLKDVYGTDFQITQTNNNQKIIAVADTKSQPVRKSIESEIKTSLTNPSIKNSAAINTVPTNMVDCPICNAKVSSNDINRHLDECLNKEVIETLCKDNQAANIKTQPSTSSQSNVKKDLKQIVGVLSTIPAYKHTSEISDNVRNEMILANSNSVVHLPLIDYKLMTKVEQELNTALIDGKLCESFDPNDVNKVKSIVKKIKYDKVVQQSDKQTLPKEEKPNEVDLRFLPSFLDDDACKIETPKIKIEPATSKDVVSQVGKTCACCGKIMDKPIEEHLDECLAFFDNNDTMPNEGASTSFANETIVIDDDDDDIFDESQIFNATGTKTPCPCCLTMIEEAEMKEHLDACLIL